ncbi:MAG: Mini-ribonuclease 3 [Halanaerobiales bacterium]
MDTKQGYTEREAALLSPGLLAYIGDSVYELMARRYSLEKGHRRLHDIHQSTISLVNATSQANFLRIIEGILTEDEENIVRRGKNTKTGNVPNNAEMMDYRLSTGFEALVGYLYLSNQEDRLHTIWNKIIESLER